MYSFSVNRIPIVGPDKSLLTVKQKTHLTAVHIAKGSSENLTNQHNQNQGEELRWIKRVVNDNVLYKISKNNLIINQM